MSSEEGTPAQSSHDNSRLASDQSKADRLRNGRRVVGALLLFSSFQWFLVQAAVAAGWRTHYSLTRNFISDLGALHCGRFPSDTGLYVCSPAHSAMNVSLILWGAAWAVGALLIAEHSHRTGYMLLALGGIGTILVGVRPEDTVFAVHALGALLQTIVGGAGMAVIGVRLLRRGHRIVGVLSVLVFIAAVVGIIATGLATDSRAFLSVGLGVWERIGIWPQCAWLTAAGIGIAWDAATRPSRTEPGLTRNTACR
ncbi:MULTISPECIES: DUF998 domain-containing protein [Streptomyces]|uniref:DUF998 domain-containing protein n=1 Tax=Streptomyces TaxID=1883 RepID=UPI00099E2C9A